MPIRSPTPVGSERKLRDGSEPHLTSDQYPGPPGGRTPPSGRRQRLHPQHLPTKMRLIGEARVDRGGGEIRRRLTLPRKAVKRRGLHTLIELQIASALAGPRLDAACSWRAPSPSGDDAARAQLMNSHARMSTPLGSTGRPEGQGETIARPIISITASCYV